MGPVQRHCSSSPEVTRLAELCNGCFELFSRHFAYRVVFGPSGVGGCVGDMVQTDSRPVCIVVHRLPLLVSPVPDPAAWAVDVPSIPWRDLSVYAFPPFPIQGKLLREARRESPVLILVAPFWPAQSWFLDLLELSVSR